MDREIPFISLAELQKDLEIRTREILRKKVIADEATVREMLLRWPWGEGTPSLCIGPNYEILGLCAKDTNEIGQKPLIIVTPRKK
jgi:hypothetical protein